LQKSVVLIVYSVIKSGKQRVEYNSFAKNRQVIKKSNQLLYFINKRDFIKKLCKKIEELFLYPSELLSLNFLPLNYYRSGAL